MKLYDMRIGFNIPECEDVIKPFESERGAYVKAEVAQALYDALKPALRYIEFVGANHTERGFEHPQQQLIDQIEKALSIADVNGEE